MNVCIVMNMNKDSGLQQFSLLYYNKLLNTENFINNWEVILELEQVSDLW